MGKNKEEMSQQCNNQSIISKWGSSFSDTISKSLEVSRGVWPVAGSDTRRLSLQTPSMTSTSWTTPSINIPASSQFSSTSSFGGGSGSPSEKECRQVFFDCAL